MPVGDTMGKLFTALLAIIVLSVLFAVISAGCIRHNITSPVTPAATVHATKTLTVIIPQATATITRTFTSLPTPTITSTLCLPAFSWGASGTGNGQFGTIMSIAANPAGDCYVLEKTRVQKFKQDGTYITQWGSHGSAPGQFDWANGIAVGGSGNVYVLEANNHRVQKFDPDGNYLTNWPCGSAKSIAVDGADNAYVVTDCACLDTQVIKYDSAGNSLTQWFSNWATVTNGIAAGGGNVYIGVFTGGEFNRFTDTGTELDTCYIPGGSLAADTAGNAIAAAGSQIYKAAPDCTILKTWQSTNAGWIATGGGGYIYAAYLYTVQVFAP